MQETGVNVSLSGIKSLIYKQLIPENWKEN